MHVCFLPVKYIIYIKDVFNVLNNSKNKTNIHAPHSQPKKWGITGPSQSPGCPVQPCHPSSYTNPHSPQLIPSRIFNYSFSCFSLHMLHLCIYFSIIGIASFPCVWTFRITFHIVCLAFLTQRCLELVHVAAWSYVSFLPHGCLVFHGSQRSSDTELSLCVHPTTSGRWAVLVNYEQNCCEHSCTFPDTHASAFLQGVRLRVELLHSALLRNT